MTGMHVLLIGNPVDGIRVYGPFATGEEAVEKAEQFADTDWWTAPLLAVDTL